MRLQPVILPELAYAYEITDNFSSFRRLSSGPSEEYPEIGTIQLDQETLADLAFRPLPSILGDWLRIAHSAYLADRFSPRRKPGNRINPYQRSRSIHLHIPVTHPGVWARENVTNQLQKILAYLTEDTWQFTFRPVGGYRSNAETQGFFAPLDSLRNCNGAVALFSGGLDSLVGAIRTLDKMQSGHLILVSGATNRRMLKCQRLQVQQLRKRNRGSTQIAHVPLLHGIQRTDSRPREDNSQRSRGFLHLSLGLIAALIKDDSTLYVFENGIGAINLPYDASQVGTANTRAVNPITLKLLEAFVSEVTGKVVHIENPFLFLTKAQMCNHPSLNESASLLAHSFSCDHFPVRKKGHPQCGTCTSCLLRREALELSNLASLLPDSDYKDQLEETEFNMQAKKLVPLRAMARQVIQLDGCLKSSSPAKALCTKFPLLSQIAALKANPAGYSEIEIQARICSLYRTYVNEWKRFSLFEMLLASAA